MLLWISRLVEMQLHGLAKQIWIKLYCITSFLIFSLTFAAFLLLFCFSTINLKVAYHNPKVTSRSTSAKAIGCSNSMFSSLDEWLSEKLWESLQHGSIVQLSPLVQKDWASYNLRTKGLVSVSLSARWCCQTVDSLSWESVLQGTQGSFVDCRY